jgi:hypothetical protein
MDRMNQQRRFIESEMDRFEKEISSLNPTMAAPPPRAFFIPAQLRRPPMHPPDTPGVSHSGHHHRPVHPPRPHLTKPSPVIIR